MNTEGIVDGLREVVEHGVELRRQAYDLEAQAKELKTAANDLLKDALTKVDKGTATVAGVGTATLMQSTRSKFDMAGFKLALVQKGVAADIIKACADANTTTPSPTTSVRFTVWKEQG